MRSFKDKDLIEALLLFIYFSGGTIRASQCYEPLATFFDLSPAELQENYDNRSAWHIRLQATRELIADEYVLRPEAFARGFWKLTENGTTEADRIKDSWGKSALSTLEKLAFPIKEAWQRPFEL
jgi:hypothetical protein